jgi:hypothetical protein
MSLSETCSCGASFTAERDDELKLLNAWRKSHRCKPQPGDLVTTGVDSRADFGGENEPEFKIGFRYDYEDDDE